jgi:hypothetical protein
MADDLVSCPFVLRLGGLQWQVMTLTSSSPFQWSASDFEILHLTITEVKLEWARNTWGGVFFGGVYLSWRFSQRKVEKVLLSGSPYPFVRLSSGNNWRARERISLIIIIRRPFALVKHFIFSVDIEGATYCCVRGMLGVTSHFINVTSTTYFYVIRPLSGRCFCFRTMNYKKAVQCSNYIEVTCTRLVGTYVLMGPIILITITPRRSSQG